jgi:hypothetical protein
MVLALAMKIENDTFLIFSLVYVNLHAFFLLFYQLLTAFIKKFTGKKILKQSESFDYG